MLFRSDGLPVVSAVDGCAGWRTTYTSGGRIAARSCLLVSGTPKRDANNVAITRYQYDSAGNRAAELYFGMSEESTTDRYGVHSRLFSTDTKRRLTRESCFAKDGSPHACEPHGSTSIRYRYDSMQGPNHHQDFLTSNGSWSTDPRYGVASLHFRYDPQGRETRIQCLNQQGEPTQCGGTGFSRMEDRFDETGSEVSSVFFDEAGERTSNVDTWERRDRKSVV